MITWKDDNYSQARVDVAGMATLLGALQKIVAFPNGTKWLLLSFDAVGKTDEKTRRVELWWRKDPIGEKSIIYETITIEELTREG